LFSKVTPLNDDYVAIIGAGSTAYYPVQYLSKKFNAKSIAIMLPKGYAMHHFDFIIAQKHDYPPQRSNIISTTVNLSVNLPNGYIVHDGKSQYVGIVIGGSNSVFNMPNTTIKSQLDVIFNEFPSHKKLITTSPRTSLEIEKLCREYEFDYQLIYSDHPDINPIPDFVEICDELFITSDSTSMISEAAANSDANIHIIMLDSDRKDTKFHKLIDIVENLDGKIDLTSQLKDINL
jgi:mitochondrial fission protein ELM1